MSSIKVLSGRATLYPPTQAKSFWRYAIHTPDGQRKVLTGGHSRDEAELRAREALGDFVPERRGTRLVPTVDEVFEQWHSANSHRWTDRTAVVYRYRYTANIQPIIGSKLITQVSASDLTHIASDVSREQGKRIRSIIKAIFTDAEIWTSRKADVYMDAIRLTGTRNDDPKRQVAKKSIPSQKWVNAAINLAHSSFQVHPLLAADNSDSVDPITGYHAYSVDVDTDDFVSRAAARTLVQWYGLPPSLLDGMRRGIPKHYKNIEKRKSDETVELASRLRQIALITALGAGGALRIGEVLALRPRHFFPREPEFDAYLSAWFVSDTDDPQPNWEHRDPLKQWNYRGRVDVVEQVSPLSSGRMHISSPKMNRERVVMLPAFLYQDYGVSRRSLRTELNETITINDADSLWNIGYDDSLKLWNAGNIPLHLLLLQRFRELFNQDARRDPERFMNCLLFPTRNSARSSGQGVLYPDNWQYQKEPTFGTFQAPANLTTRYISPLYDYASAMLGEEIINGGRNGWTHHSLRHLAVSQWVSRGTPIPLVAKQAGHTNENFTLQRYAAAITDGLDEKGFEG